MVSADFAETGSLVDAQNPWQLEAFLRVRIFFNSAYTTFVIPGCLTNYCGFILDVLCSSSHRRTCRLDSLPRFSAGMQTYAHPTYEFCDILLTVYFVIICFLLLFFHHHI